MIIKLVAFVLVLSVVSCAHVCTEDGHFANPDDKTSYIECIDGKEYFRRCARASDGSSYMVFDGRQCVEPAPTFRENVFTCPQPNGLFRYMTDDKQYYECVENSPVLRQCPEGMVFDGLVCSQPRGPTNEFVAPEFTCPRVSGVFGNPSDRYRHTYWECANGVPTKRNCPSYTAYRDGQYHQDKMVFDGHSCVRVSRSPEFIDNRKPVYEERNPEFVDNRGVRPHRQVATLDYRCPGTDGLFYSSPQSNTWYECVGGEAKRIYTCESGTTLDTSTRICRGTRVTDEEIVVHRPETVPVETSPRVVELTRPAEEPNRFYPDQGYYGRRYRRNGRVEFEDQHTGSVIVDTWNEGAWRWERNPNGARLPLPIITDWQPYDYYRTRVGASSDTEYRRPNEEYRRPAEEYRRPAEEYRRPAEEYRRPAVQYVNRPRYYRNQ